MEINNVPEIIGKKELKINDKNLSFFLLFTNYKCKKLSFQLETEIYWSYHHDKEGYLYIETKEYPDRITKFQLPLCGSLKRLEFVTPWKEIPNFNSCKKLESLSLDQPYLTSFRSNLSFFQNLKTLEIKAPLTFFYRYSLLKNPQLIFLSFQQFRVAEKLISTVLRSVHNLQHLELIDCNLSSLEIKNSCLKTINLRKNKFTSIPLSLRNCSKLISIDLNENLIEDSTLEWMWDLKNLQILSLEKNRMKQFPYAIFSFKNILKVNLKRNHIQINQIVVAPKSFLMNVDIEIDVKVYSELEFEKYQMAEEIEGECYDLIPDEYLCSISKQLMIQPVMNETGNTYEYFYIKKWLNSNHTDPIFKKQLRNKSLTPNNFLRSSIFKFILDRYTRNSNLDLNQTNDNNTDTDVFDNTDFMTETLMETKV